MRRNRTGEFGPRCISWRRPGGLVAAALVIVGSGFISGGCGVAPFNPKAEVRVAEVSPEVLSPYMLKDGGMILPRARVSVASANGVEMSVEGYTVDFYGPDGLKIESPALSVNGGLTRRVIAMGPTAANQAVTTMLLDIFTTDVYRYVSGGTWTDTRDDITPLFARFTLYGKDTNDNFISFGGSVTISSAPNNPENFLETIEVLKDAGLFNEISFSDLLKTDLLTTEVKSWTD